MSIRNCLLLMLLFLISNCHSNQKKQLSKNELKLKIIKSDLEGNSEKISLLSIIKRVNYDTLNFILADYYFATENKPSDSLKYYTAQAVNNAAEKYNISKRKVAELVFSYQFEMLTKEEIYDQQQAENDANQEDPPDPY